MYLVNAPFWLKKIYPKLHWNFSRTEKCLYLTFDDGPTQTYTKWILDTLEQYNAKASFFLIGKNIDAHPALFSKIKAAGHTIGNHTYNHFNGWKHKTKAYIDNVEKCQKLSQSELFRPPYGRISRSQIKALRAKYKIIMWDVLSGDFDTSISPEQCYKNIIKHTKNGSIIVMHDSEKAGIRMTETLPRILKHFSEKGYRFKAIPSEVLL